MNNLDQEVNNFVLSKSGSWADSTISTAYHKLRIVNKIGLNPQILWETLSKEGYGKYSISSYFILARSFEEATKKTKKIRLWMQDNRIKFKNAYQKKEKSMTSEQYEKFLSLSPNSDIYNFLVLIGKAGLRKSEALKVKWTDINNGLLHVTSGKGGKSRYVPFDNNWLKYDFESVDVQILPENLVYWKFFKDVCGEFTPHDFRCFYANKIVNMTGANLEDCRDLLGHSDISSTAKYLRVDRNRQHKLVMEAFK